jgi:hypothetical protein
MTGVKVSAGTADPAGRLLRLCLPVTAVVVVGDVGAPVVGPRRAARRSAGCWPSHRYRGVISWAARRRAAADRDGRGRLGVVGVVFVLGLAWVVLAPAHWLSPNHVAITIVISTVTWVFAQAVGSARLRVPAFDTTTPHDPQRDGTHAPPSDGAAATRTNRNGADHKG